MEMSEVTEVSEGHSEAAEEGNDLVGDEGIRGQRTCVKGLRWKSVRAGCAKVESI